jgi:hypothetical protein
VRAVGHITSTVKYINVSRGSAGSVHLRAHCAPCLEMMRMLTIITVPLTRQDPVSVKHHASHSVTLLMMSYLCLQNLCESNFSMAIYVVSPPNSNNFLIPSFRQGNICSNRKVLWSLSGAYLNTIIIPRFLIPSWDLHLR